MPKFFLFLYLQEPLLRDYLNLAIYLLNPRERWPAHVTIAGPFSRTSDIPRSLRFVEQLSILGRGRFENGSRQTIYLRVGSRDIASHIEKPDYPNAIPHLTLYTGDDKELADLLYNELGKIRLFGVFYSTHFQVVESGQQYNLDFKLQVRPELLPSTEAKSLDQLRLLDKSARVKMAVEAVQIGFASSLDSASRMKLFGAKSYESINAPGTVRRFK